MFNKITCFIASSISIFLCSLFEIYAHLNRSKLSSTGIFSILCFLIFPVILYYIYLNSNFNRWVGFILALSTSIICYTMDVFAYHFSTDFKYWGTGLGTEIMTGLFIIFHLAIALVCAVIYFVIWWRQKK
ncbi:MAG: hypothetical protein LBR79_01825 [Oscillospiraceae bacterium]|nr:hypothetical protein [Oscillospiraceae bacterium]